MKLTGPHLRTLAIAVITALAAYAIAAVGGAPIPTP